MSVLYDLYVTETKIDQNFITPTIIPKTNNSTPLTLTLRHMTTPKSSERQENKLLSRLTSHTPYLFGHLGAGVGRGGGRSGLSRRQSPGGSRGGHGDAPPGLQLPTFGSRRLRLLLGTAPLLGSGRRQRGQQG